MLQNIIIIGLLLGFIFPSFAREDYLGNETITSYKKTKKILEKKVYFDHRISFYCGAPFRINKQVRPLKGFNNKIYKSRSRRIEWEHIVPAENFGRTFQAWREGDPSCITNKGKLYKGRRCATKMNIEYRYMQSDMYNLAPAIGSVNAARKNYNFVMLGDVKSTFGSCSVKIKNRKVEPPELARGQIARTYLYMDSVYPRYKMSPQQRKLMETWDKEYPVSEFECLKNKRIYQIQKNRNPILDKRCGSRRP